MRLATVAILIAGGLAGCSTPGTGGSPLVPDKAFKLTANTSIKLAEIATGALVLGAIQLIYDPLAPNWSIEETRISEDTFRLSLRMKRYHTGGAGESMQVLKRRAMQLQSDLGYGTYQLVEYSEGIESETLGAHRVAEGVVRLAQRREADSFMLNTSQ